ncbi:carboxypeptidase-like regulatory domain-containing protein [Flavobacteriaceae bacterium F89]|uniref:Carboxypeptidase-like regulatory domain-containing protein n=1 Tax=Cerina litoralis TaxID=2874477 RepID=A0AAE3EX58_9FLAO|nr:carboxypeptidase-like regulatory domain-containing protein [Cerina litoralis]MCG2461211.1 carboxypeptidase-like regulatory domain-containing protein [Cerina litoralis]
MHRNRGLFFFFFMVCVSVGAQSFFSSNLEGRVQSADKDLADVYVMNITARKATITDANGYFSIRASINDSLVFTALQYKRKVLVVSLGMLSSKSITVPLEEAITQLDEVVVMPYNLTGDMGRDLRSLDVGPVTTASTLGLPNAYVIPPTKAERELYEATTGGGVVPLNPILNAISGRTKMLKQRVARDEKYARTQRVREFYADSLYTELLQIPEEKIEDFMYFCEVDPQFGIVVDSHDRLRIWEFLKKKSTEYRSPSVSTHKEGVGP